MYQYCLLDINQDGENELIYDIQYGISETLYILKIVDGKLIDKVTTYDEYLAADVTARKRAVYVAQADEELDDPEE